MPAPVSPSSPAARLVIEPAIDGYVPGVCNIGPWEIRRRWVGGILGLAIAALLLAVLVAAGTPTIARLTVVAPAWGGWFSVLQARRRFCGAYAMRRISNFGVTHATISTVEEAAAHRADMVATARLTRDSFVLAFVTTVVAVLLPL